MWANPTNMPSLRSVVIVSCITIVWILLNVTGYSFLAGLFLILSAFVFFLFSPYTVGSNRFLTRKNEFVDTPWGGYRNVAEGEGYKIKVLVIVGGESTSLQSHKHRNEIWTISKGTARIQYEDKEFIMVTGETVKILSGLKHRITNDGEDPIVITEVWLGSVLEEEDIIRFEDRYGRV